MALPQRVADIRNVLGHCNEAQPKFYLLDTDLHEERVDHDDPERVPLPA